MDQAISHPESPPDDWLGLWVAPDDKAVMLQRAGNRFVATITPGIGLPPFPANEVFGASSPTHRLPASWHRGDRLARFEIEAEAATTGRLYLLNVAVANADPDDWEGFTWRPATLADPIAALRLIPNGAAGFMDAVAYMEDEGYIPWAEPWVNYRKGTPDEAAQFLAWLAGP